MSKKDKKGHKTGDKEGLHEISDILDESVDFDEPKWVLERYMSRFQDAAENVAKLDLFENLEEGGIKETFKHWEAFQHDQFEFEDFDPMSSEDDAPDLDPNRPLTKKEKQANKIKDQYPGLLYLKIPSTGKTNRTYGYEGQTLHNIVDIYALRKRLYTLKDIEKADFATLLGSNYAEFNYGKDDDLDFHSNIDSGNLYRVIRGLNDRVYYLEVMPDTNSTGHKKWFHFIATHGKKGTKATFRVFNFSNKGMQVNRVHFKSKREEKKKGTGWKLLPTSAKYYSNDDHPECFDENMEGLTKGYYTLEFTFEFTHDNDQISFALMPAYSYEDLQFDSFVWTMTLKKEKGFTLNKKLLCYSLIGRKIFYIEASGFEEKEKKKNSDKKPKKIIVLMARTHPGESASSYVLKGMVDELINMNSTIQGQFLRDNFTFLIFPMMNPDGVAIGNSRAAVCGNDLNEVWSQPDRFVHPEVFYAKKILTKLKKDNEIIFVADFHANYEKTGFFLYGSSYQLAAKAAKEQKDFLAVLSDCTTYFSANKCRLIAPTEKRESASVVLARELGVQHSYSIQASSSQSTDESAFNAENYETFGKQFCQGLSTFLCRKLGTSCKASPVMQEQTDSSWRRVFKEDGSTDQQEAPDLLNESCGSCTSVTFKDTRRDGKCLSDMLRGYHRIQKMVGERTEELSKAADQKHAQFEEVMQNLELNKQYAKDLEEQLKVVVDPEEERLKELEKKEKEEKRMRIQREFEERKAKFEAMVAEDQKKNDPKLQLMDHFKKNGQLATGSRVEVSTQQDPNKTASISNQPSLVNLNDTKEITVKPQSSQGPYQLLGQQNNTVSSLEAKKGESRKDLGNKPGPGDRSHKNDSKPLTKNSLSNLESQQDFSKLGVVKSEQRPMDKGPGKTITIGKKLTPNYNHLSSAPTTVNPSPVPDSQRIPVQKQVQPFSNKDSKTEPERPQRDFQMFQNSNLGNDATKIMNSKVQGPPQLPAPPSLTQINEKNKEKFAIIEPGKYSVSLNSSPVIPMRSELNVKVKNDTSVRLPTNVIGKPLKVIPEQIGFTSEKTVVTKSDFRINSRQAERVQRAISPQKVSTMSEGQAPIGVMGNSFQKATVHLPLAISTLENFDQNGVKSPQSRPHHSHVMQQQVSEVRKSMSRDYRDKARLTNTKSQFSAKQEDQFRVTQSGNVFKEASGSNTTKAQYSDSAVQLRQSKGLASLGSSPKNFGQTSSGFREEPIVTNKRVPDILAVNGLTITSSHRDKISDSNAAQRSLKLKHRSGFVSRIVKQEQIARGKALIAKEWNSEPAHLEHASFSQGMQIKGVPNPRPKFNLETAFRNTVSNRFNSVGKAPKAETGEKVDMTAFWDSNLKNNSNSPVKGKGDQVLRRSRGMPTKEELIKEIYLLK